MPSVTHLPSITPSNRAERERLPQKSPCRKTGKPKTNGQQNTGSKRSVHWLDDRPQVTSGSLSKKKMIDPDKVWAQYTKMLWSNCSLGKPHVDKTNTKGMMDPSEKRRQVMKCSYPCPSARKCCLCVYTRLLGPVKVYFSSLSRSSVQPSKESTRRGPGKDVARQCSEASQEARQTEKPKHVLLKERWLSSSTPTGEVIVPELPDNSEDRWFQLCQLPNTLLGDWNNKKRKDSWLKDKQRSVSTDTNNWLRDSAPSGQIVYPEHLNGKDSVRKPRLPPYVTLKIHADSRKTAGWTIRGELPLPHLAPRRLPTVSKTISTSWDSKSKSRQREQRLRLFSCMTQEKNLPGNK